LFSRNLFSDAQEVVVAAGRSREPPNHPEAAQRRSVPMDASRKFRYPGSLDVVTPNVSGEAKA
jgi:hypothetical protein